MLIWWWFILFLLSFYVGTGFNVNDDGPSSLPLSGRRLWRRRRGKNTHPFSFHPSIHPSIHPAEEFFFLTIIYLLPCFFRLFGSIDLRSDEMALKKKIIIRDRELFGIICHLLVCKCCWPALSFFISFFFFIDFGLLFASFFYSFCWAFIWQRNTSR